MVTGGAGSDQILGSEGDDILRLSNFHGADTVERIDGGAGSNRIVGGAWAARLDFSGTELVNIARIEGSAGNNVIIGSNGNDVLAGLGGPDQISGGLGNDAYLFNRGDGVDTWIENDATAGNQDIARFGLDVLYDQIWFQKKGNNLEAQIIGTTDKAIIKDWYLGGARQIERFETADGHALLNSQLDQLVQAMAAFNPPPTGQSSLPDNYRQALQPVLAASWS
jgi:Ca2+-binding RTX toxin-like protein